MNALTAPQVGTALAPASASAGALLMDMAAIEAAAKTEAQEAPANESAHDGDTLTMGQINSLIAPLKVDAAGLEQLGFTPSKTVKAAKHYAAHQLPAMVQAMVTHLQGVLATA